MEAEDIGHRCKMGTWMLLHVNQAAEREWNTELRKASDVGLSLRKALLVLRSIDHRAYCVDTIAKGDPETSPKTINTQAGLMNYSRAVPGVFQGYSRATFHNLGRQCFSKATCHNLGSRIRISIFSIPSISGISNILSIT